MKIKIPKIDILESGDELNRYKDDYESEDNPKEKRRKYVLYQQKAIEYRQLFAQYIGSNSDLSGLL